MRCANAAPSRSARRAAHERRPGLERGSDARGFPGVPRRAPRPPAPTGRLGDAAGAAHLRCRRLAGAAPGHRHAAARRAYYRALGLDPDELFAADFRALREGRAYRTLQRYLRDGGEIAKVADPRLREQLLRARELDRQLADTGELEALLAGLAGRFVAPGPGGDPIRNPQVPSGRNLFAFEADKVPTRAAYEAAPRPSANCWKATAPSTRAGRRKSSPSASGRRKPCATWASSKARRCTPSACARAGTPVAACWRWTSCRRRNWGVHGWTWCQVTSVYRDQFDGFMRLLAEAIERLAVLDEPGNPLAGNSQALERRLRERGVEAPLAQRLSRLRLFGNAPGDYGTGVTQLTLDSTRWDDDSALAEQFLGRLQYAYGSRDWGVKLDGGNLFAEQLKGVQAAILSRSRRSTACSPPTTRSSTSAACRWRYATSTAPARRCTSPTCASASRAPRPPRSSSPALRGRYLSPQWIAAMQREGYAGSLEMLDLANNLGLAGGGSHHGPRRPVAGVARHLVMDRRELGLAEWFETHNPTAQAQIIARMAEAIRKGYWDASEQTRRELAERWWQLAAAGAGEVGAATTREFIERMAGGFGEAAAQAEGAAASGAGETVSGRVLEEVAPPPSGEPQPWGWPPPCCALLRRRRRPAIRSQSSSDGKSLMNGLETSLYELTRLFLLPVLLLILAALAYAFVAPAASPWKPAAPSRALPLAPGGLAGAAWRQQRRPRTVDHAAPGMAADHLAQRADARPGGNHDPHGAGTAGADPQRRTGDRREPGGGVFRGDPGPGRRQHHLLHPYRASPLAAPGTARRRTRGRPADALPRTRRGGRPDPLDGQP